MPHRVRITVFDYSHRRVADASVSFGAGTHPSKTDAHGEVILVLSIGERVSASKQDMLGYGTVGTADHLEIHMAQMPM